MSCCERKTVSLVGTRRNKLPKREYDQLLSDIFAGTPLILSSEFIYSKPLKCTLFHLLSSPLLQPVSAVMWGITVMLTQDSVSVLQTLLVRGATAVLPTTGAMISPLDAR